MESNVAKMTCKQGFRLLVFLLLTLLAGCFEQQLASQEKPFITVADTKGHWLVLNIWADWCAPCRDEIPQLNQLAQSEGVLVIGYDFDGAQGVRLRKKRAFLGIEFAVIERSPFSAFAITPPDKLPVTYIINPQGRLVKTLYGPQTMKGINVQLSRLRQEGVGNR